MFSTVLVMLALDERDDSLLDAVVAGAEPFATRRVVVVHVHNADPVAGPLADLVQPEAPARPPELDAAVERLRAALPDLDITGAYPSGPPEAVLNHLTDEHDVDLVMMGRHPATAGKAGWGSASRKILRLTTCSAMVVPQGSTLDLQRVVAGFDFSQYAAMALGVACQIGESVDAVYQYSMDTARAGRTREEFNAVIQARAEKHLETELMPLLQIEVPPRVVVHDGGRVADALIAQAGDAPIVLGSRGLSPLARLLIGSSADRVAGRSRSPVLVVRKKGDTLNLFERLFHKA
jgi:nucleotide-binding universal stress UspA family protein